MYGLYDKEGILRFVDSDKDACIAYAELFELGSTNYCLMDLANHTKNLKILILIRVWECTTIKTISTNLAVVHCPVQKCNSIFRTSFCKHITYMIIDSSFTNS